MAHDIFASSPELDIRKRWALSQLQQASDPSGVHHPLQAVAKALQGAMGGYLAGEANREDKAAGEAWLNSLPGVGNPQAMPQPPMPTTQPAPPMALPNSPAPSVNPRAAMASGTAPPVTGPRPGGPVMPSGKVWGDAEAEAAGLYEPSKNVKVASMSPEIQQAPAAPQMQPPAQPPMQTAQAANLPGQAAPNAPVGNRSSVNIPPDVQAAIRSLGSDPRTRPQALQLYMQYAKPVESVAPMNAEQRKQWNVPEGVSAGLDTVTGKPVFSQPANSVNVNTAANPLMEGVGKQVLAQRQAAQTAATSSIPAIHEARKALDEGAITGALAGGRIDLAKVGSLFGLTDPAQVVNSEVLQSSIGQGVLSHIKELGANPSNADRDYIEKVQGGKITLEEKSIRRILDIQEKYARQAIRNFNTDAQKLMTAPGGNEAYKSVAPLMRFDEPGQYAPPEKKAAAPAQGATGNKPATVIQNGHTYTLNPKTGKYE